MKTENEKTKLKNIEEQLSQVMLQLNVQVDGEDIDDVDPTLKAMFVGMPLATIDALFAIRDGEPWRDLNSPEFIARKVLRDMGIGD